MFLSWRHSMSNSRTALCYHGATYIATLLQFPDRTDGIICGWVSLPLVSCESPQDLAVGKLNRFNFSGNGRCPWVYIMIFVHSLRFVSEPRVPRHRGTVQCNLQQNRWSLRMCALTMFIQTVVTVDLILYYIELSGCSKHEIFSVTNVYVTFLKILKVKDKGKAFPLHARLWPRMWVEV